MHDKHKNCRYRFLRWLIEKACHSRRIYWLLWGVLVVVGICAWRFGLVGISLF